MKLFYTLLLLIFISGCTKHAGDYIDDSPTATLVISQPATGSVINKVDSIRIAGTATAPAIMHGYDVYVTKQNDTTRIASVSIHDHNTTLIIDSKLSPISAGNYEAHILLKLDHDGHTLHKSVNFKTQ